MISTLIIKGTKHEAALAAAARGVPLVYVRETDRRETIGRSVADVDTLNRWLCEPGDAPYPAGTLLFWSAERV